MLPPTGFRYAPDLQEKAILGAVHDDDGSTLLTVEQRTVEGIDILVFRSAKDGERYKTLSDIPAENQPIYAEAYEGILWAIVFSNPPPRIGTTVIGKTPEPDCPACGGKGLPPTRNGCLMCGETYQSRHPWVVIGHYEPTGFEWIRWSGSKEACEKAIEKWLGHTKGVTYRIERQAKGKSA